jgi:hypothetical protein
MSGSDSTTDFGEHAARMELARCLDVCLDCRQCVELCGVFPATIELVGTRSSADTGLLTPIEQDRIISLCSPSTERGDSGGGPDSRVARSPLKEPFGGHAVFGDW